MKIIGLKALRHVRLDDRPDKINEMITHRRSLGRHHVVRVPIDEYNIIPTFNSNGYMVQIKRERDTEWHTLCEDIYSDDKSVRTRPLVFDEIRDARQALANFFKHMADGYDVYL